VAKTPEQMLALSPDSSDGYADTSAETSRVTAVTYVELIGLGSATEDKTSASNRIRTRHRSVMPAEAVWQWNIKDYYPPVKVKLLPDRQALVTEYDGDQFHGSSGRCKFLAIGSGRHLRGAEAVNFATQTFNQPTDLQREGEGYRARLIRARILSGHLAITCTRSSW
jgi:hypothetical protein